MKIPRRALVISLAIYGVDVLLLCGENQEKHFIRLNHLKSDFFIENCLGSYWYGMHEGNTHFIMCIRSNEFSIIAHECVHIAHCVMDHMGIPISLKNTEVEAYIVGFLADCAGPHVTKILKEPLR